MSFICSSLSSHKNFLGSAHADCMPRAGKEGTNCFQTSGRTDFRVNPAMAKFITEVGASARRVHSLHTQSSRTPNDTSTIPTCFLIASVPKPATMEQSERIYSLVRASLLELESLSSTLGNTARYSAESAITRSHLSKFKLWSGCLGAHRITGTRSLSYRLRDASSIRQTVLFLLENLERYVKEGKWLKHTYKQRTICISANSSQFKPSPIKVSLSTRMNKLRQIPSMKNWRSISATTTMMDLPRTLS